MSLPKHIIHYILDFVLDDIYVPKPELKDLWNENHFIFNYKLWPWIHYVRPDLFKGQFADAFFYYITPEAIEFARTHWINVKPQTEHDLFAKFVLYDSVEEYMKCESILFNYPIWIILEGMNSFDIVHYEPLIAKLYPSHTYLYFIHSASNFLRENCDLKSTFPFIDYKGDKPKDVYQIYPQFAQRILDKGYSISPYFYRNPSDIAADYLIQLDAPLSKKAEINLMCNRNPKMQRYYIQLIREGRARFSAEKFFELSEESLQVLYENRDLFPERDLQGCQCEMWYTNVIDKKTIRRYYFIHKLLKGKEKTEWIDKYILKYNDSHIQ